MSYQRRRRRPQPGSQRQLAGDTSHGPSWYVAMGGVSGRPPGPRVAGRAPAALGSLGNDTGGTTTLSDPTIADPSVQWQADVLAQLRAGVATLQKAELQKWLQILATVSIPLSAAIWRMIFRRGADPTM